MKLFWVHDNARWGFSINVVRAENPEQARQLATGSPIDDARVEVVELSTDGSPGVLQCYDDSPDTGDRDY